MDNLTATELAYKNGYEDGLKAARPAMISCADRLPDIGEEVLVFRGETYMLAERIDKGYFKFECWGTAGDEYAPIRDTDKWVSVAVLIQPHKEEKE